MTTKPPSYDTIWMLLVRIQPERLQPFIRTWFNQLKRAFKDKVLALDGKRARRASYLDHAIHLVEWVVTDQGLTIAEERVPSKKGESVALQPILECIDVEGAMLSMDALYTNIKTASLIRSKKADYLLARKKNQGNRRAEVENFFNQASQVDACEASVDHWSA